jgi:NADH-quinone oxidoreductase subunit D
MIGYSTVFEWAFQDREPFLELTQQLTGARLTGSFIVPGGVRRNLPDNFRSNVLKVLSYLEKRLVDYNKLFVNNPVTIARLQDVGVISKTKAARVGIVGPNLRASGVAYDVRKIEPYCAYSDLDFDLITEEAGDCYARLIVRREEMKQSMRLIRQILDKMPDGPYFAEKYMKLINPKMRELVDQSGVLRFPALFTTLKPAKGESTSRVEGARGEVFYYIVSDGSTQPYRLRMITPSFKNVAGYEAALIGQRLADVPAVYGSLDYFPPEADR